MKHLKIIIISLLVLLGVGALAVVISKSPVGQKKSPVESPSEPQNPSQPVPVSRTSSPPAHDSRSPHRHDHSVQMDPLTAAIKFKTEHLKKHPTEKAELFVRIVRPKNAPRKTVRTIFMYTKGEQVYTLFGDKEVPMDIRKEDVVEGQMKVWAPAIGRAARAARDIPCTSDHSVRPDRSIQGTEKILQAAGIPWQLSEDQRSILFAYAGNDLMYSPRTGTQVASDTLETHKHPPSIPGGTKNP